jgi:hypothetical protein
VTVALTFGGPAHAASGWTQSYFASVGSETYVLKKDDNERARSTAKSDATVKLSDKSADGLGQRLYWRVNGASTYNVCENRGGSGTSKTCSVTNNKFIQYKFCVMSTTANVACADEDGFQT